MTNDSFYKSMTDNQLQAAHKEIEKNLEFDSTKGMVQEMELIRQVAKERGVKLGNSFDATKGYLEFALKDTD